MSNGSVQRRLVMRSRIARRYVFALLLLIGLPWTSDARGTGAADPADLSVDALVQKLSAGSFTLVDSGGQVMGHRVYLGEPPERLFIASIVETLQHAALSDNQSVRLWQFFGKDINARMATLPVVKALIAASRSPMARKPLWSVLVALAREHDVGSRDRDNSLLGLFERHRTEILPLFGEARETEESGDDMVELLLETQVFGDDFDKGVDWLSGYDPAPLARKMERERALGKPVQWEAAAFWSMVRWKDRRIVSRASKPPRTLAALDHIGESFIIIFNCLHDMNPKYREAMVYGLGPTEVFNLVVGGEAELYRLGTSTYRSHLHTVIMRGIRESGSLESFLERAAPAWLGPEAAAASSRRAMIFLRIATTFGLLEPVIGYVRERGRFVAAGIGSLNDARHFEGNSGVIMDILTSSTKSPAITQFKSALLEQLYARLNGETDTTTRSVYGSLLSVYQTVTGDYRNRAIDRDFPLNDAIRLPFDRLFTSDGNGRHTHRMFMYMDRDVDAVTTYASFRGAMQSRSAVVFEARDHVVYRIAARRRLIEIYVNKPTAAGLREGIASITSALRDLRVETIIGRGHTSIVKSMKTSARQILGDRTADVAAIFVGTCGGDAAVRGLIDTFGYRSFVASRSTGRMAVNNALIIGYIDALLALPDSGRLDLEAVVAKSLSPFMRDSSRDDLRHDASFYRVATTTVLTARLFDAHVRGIAQREAPVQW